MTTGLIGTGRMGHAIGERLAECGHDLVVWNRTPSKAEGIPRAVIAESPAAVAARADIVISVQGDEAALDAVYFGPGGLCSGSLDGTVVVEMCTTRPERTRALAEAVATCGGAFVECPVGGTVGPARAGELLGLAGGEAADFERARPVLEQITRRLEHLGPVGSGAAMKLAINLPLMVYWSAVGEAVGLARAEGVPADRAFDILADSSGAIGAARKRLPVLLQVLKSGEVGAPMFDLRSGIKDMRLMEALAAEHGLPATTVAAARARAETAEQGGWGDRDTSLYGLFDIVTKRQGR